MASVRATPSRPTVKDRRISLERRQGSGLYHAVVNGSAGSMILNTSNRAFTGFPKCADANNQAHDWELMAKLTLLVTKSIDDRGVSTATPSRRGVHPT